MKGSSDMATSLLCLLALASSALAANVISMNVFKPQGPSGVAVRPRHLLSRSSITEILANNETGGSYMADITVGTPGQPITLVLDTGSSDVFVLAKTADQCTSPRLEAQYGGCTGGLFDSTKSSTFKTVTKGGFSIMYVDQTGSSGDYISDTLTIGGATITGLQMGLAFKTTTGVGIMGVGYDTNEATTKRYPSIIDQMVTQKLINTKAYSLYLDDLASSTGSILFGGIDTAKFTGTLIGLPIQKETSGVISSFTVAMTSLTVVDSSGTSNILTSSSQIPVILDSGTSLTYLPDSLVAKIVSYLKAYDDSNGSGNIFVDCNLRNTQSGLTFNYGFGGTNGPVIKVPITEFIIDIPDGAISGRLPFASTCFLGIMGAGSDSNLLGDTFLRSAYVVYDLQNNEIALAQTKFDSSEANVQEIPAGATSIPLVSGFANQVTVVQTATGLPGAGRTTGTSAATIVATNAASSASSVSTTTTTSSKSAATRSVPAFDKSGILVLGLSCLFVAAGGAIFVI